MDDKNQTSAISDQSSDEAQESTENVEETTQPAETAVVEPEQKPETTEENPSNEEAAKSSESEATGAVESTSTEGNSTESNSQQTGSEAPSETSEPETSKPSDASTTDEPTPQSKSDNPNARWYVVHTYSGHENKVSLTLKQRVESEHLEEKILDVLVPMQEKIEIKSGKKVNIKEKIFPGYILVKMVLDDISWLAVRTTQGVTSFVGMGNKPTPISDAEVATIVKFTQSEAPMYKQVFTVNDAVKIVDGPFADFIGKIDSIDEEKGKVRVLVSIFGRETPVELDFLQIKKI